LLTVYTKLGKLKNPETFWGWLNTTTANRCVDLLRRDNVELQFAQDEEGRSVLGDLEEVDEQQVPDKAMDNTETTRMIEEIVNNLPEAQRICVLMYYYDEMSVKDIAAALDVPENTVKSRLNYARKAVKEQVLDYEKKGVKLYGLSPLPFMLYFLLHAAEETADSAMADAMAKRAMELDAPVWAEVAGQAADPSAMGKGAAARGSAAFRGLSTKVIAGILAGVLAVGGVAIAATAINRGGPEPAAAVTETLPPETEYIPAETAEPEPTEEVPKETGVPVAEDELIPADRLSLLDGIAYYGDPAQCRMTVNQARAYAELLENSADAPYAALIDIGEGHPVLVLARGTDGGAEPGPGTSWHSFYGRLEVWQYLGGQAEMAAAAHQVYCKAGEGFVFHNRMSGTEGKNPCFSADAYGVEDGVLSGLPIASALVEVLPDFDTTSQSGGEFMSWEDWRGHWGEGGQTSIVMVERGLYFSWAEYYYEDGWTILATGADITTGDADDGMLDNQEFSLGTDTCLL
ncbi:MAG: sigma-70 family RNA polymerase sigma factor, partial [Oscillospiraceae bacterium]|nr:sigma-70 family RNA polymerase sigma factor [Oscillospiraceae bacterium]